MGFVFSCFRGSPCSCFRGMSVSRRPPPGRRSSRRLLGTFIIDLTPDAAPNHVAYFTKLAQEGAYEGTTFHRVVKYGMVQGGDPISKDPAKRSLYGTGGQNAVKAEARAEKMTRGSVAAVLVPGRPDSAGAQFFVVLADQPTLGGQYTVFGQVSDGMEVLQKISETPVDAVRPGDRARRDQARDHPRQAGGAVRHRVGGSSWLATAPSSTPAWVRSPSSSSRTRRRRPSGSSCGSRRRASTPAWRSTGSRPASSSRPARSTRRHRR